MPNGSGSNIAAVRADGRSLRGDPAADPARSGCCWQPRRSRSEAGSRVAIEAGEKLVAENRVQEVRPKFEALEDLDYERHFIGNLQSNKINALLPYVSCIETLDRLSLARKLHRKLEAEGKSRSRC